MSQNHALLLSNWSHQDLQSCAVQVSRLLGQPVQIACVEALSRQGAINHHYRLALTAEADAPRTLVLRTRGCEVLTDLDMQSAHRDHAAFPATYLNDMARQHQWHTWARRAGAGVPESFGVVTPDLLGPALLLEDLGPQRPRLNDCSRLPLELQRAYLRAALSQLVALHSFRPPPAQQWAPPPVPAVDPVIAERTLGLKRLNHYLMLQQVSCKTAQACGTASVALHGDFRAANIWTWEPKGQDANVTLLDLDFAGMGPAVADLAWLTAPCWATPGLDIESTWLLENYQALGGSGIEPRSLGLGQLKAQLRWFAIALQQCTRWQISPDQLYASDPQQHPKRVLADALALAELWV